MPSTLCACGQRVTTTPSNVGRKRVCPECRSRVAFPPPEYAATKDFEIASSRPPFPGLDGTDQEMETWPPTTEEARWASMPIRREAPPETSLDEPWFFRAADISARASLVLGVGQFLLVGCVAIDWAGAGAVRMVIDSACLLLGISFASPAILLLADIARNIRRSG